MKYLFAFTAIFALLSLESCVPQAGANGENQTLNLDLSGSWVLNYISKDSGTSINKGFPSKKPTLTLESVSKKMTGNTGCNQMFGSFTTNQNKISFSDVGSTKMYCQEVKENEYLQMIAKVDSYKIESNQLVFMDKDNNVLLKYSKNK